MSYVTINAVKVPDDHRDEFEQRFAARAGNVGKAHGFEAFELLKPEVGTDLYLVYTRWTSKDDFNAWVSSPDFMRAHAPPEGRQSMPTSSELWAFDVIQREYP